MLRSCLAQLKLSQYADEFEHAGFDDVYHFLKELDEDALRGIAHDIGMKPGHAVKFANRFPGTEPVVPPMNVGGEEAPTADSNDVDLAAHQRRLDAHRLASRNHDTRRILELGFVETPRCQISPRLRAAALHKVSHTAGMPISNASEHAIDGSLAQCLRQELSASSTIALACKTTFDTPYFSIPYLAVLAAEPGKPPQLPHADDTCNKELFGVTHLQDGQAPTLMERYKADRQYPTGMEAECPNCKRTTTLSDEVMRMRLHRRLDYLCDRCKGSSEVSKRRRLPEASFGTILQQTFRELLEPGAPYLCKHPCGAPRPRAGDGFIALPTLVHRGPGTMDSPKTRYVLFYTVRPQYSDMEDDEHAYDPSLEYSPDTQVHAAYILHHLSPGKGMRSRVQHIYEASTHAYDLSAFTPDK